MKAMQFLGSGLVGVMIGFIILFIVFFMDGVIQTIKYDWHTYDISNYYGTMELYLNEHPMLSPTYTLITAGLGMYFIMPLFG